ncbi:MAG: hypothetical protein K2X06_15020 [Burkholderiales bacterium]|nr:hypothetical protein [Burkholderiales bacterium]
MRYVLIALSILLGAATPAMAQVSIGISIPGVSIGIHQPVYPELVPVPGYPVYYAPHARVNYFFYDGLYWVYQDDRWYSSAWYDGPWDYVEPYDVPLFVLRVPVRYYLHPPVYFHGWVVTAPPRWDLHWGPRWAQHRHGWDHWDRRVVYAPAPLPVYQRHYHGERYPRAEYQQVIRREHYHYQPRDHVVRERYHERTATRPQAQAWPAPQNPPAQRSADSRHEQRPPREREHAEPQRPEAMQVLPQQRAQPRQEIERRAQPQPQPRETREREESRRPEAMQVLPQQRAAILQERQQQQQQQRQEPAARAQPAPRPQQAQDRGAQDRGDRHHRDHGERRGQERGGDRGNDRR